MAAEMMPLPPLPESIERQPVRRAKPFWGPRASTRREIPVCSAQAALGNLWRSATGWLCAGSGWLGVALWYLQVLGGTRPSEHFLGVLCCLILTQWGVCFCSGRRG